MNARHLFILAAAALVALAAALWSSSLREAGVSENALLVPHLADQINNVSALNISTAGGVLAVTIRRIDDGWMVEQKYNYAADTGVLRSTLLKLGRARILEQKTANPELYDRLGVKDILSDDAAGKLVEIEGLQQPVQIIIGKSAGSTSDTYVRQPDEAASMMIRGSLEIPADPVEWLDRDITDIPASTIQSVTLEFSDGGRYEIDKVSRSESNFAVDGIPFDRELSTPASPNMIGTGLSALQLDDVTPADNIDIDGHEPVNTRYRSFDGLVINIISAEIDGKYYARLEASYDPSQARRFAVDDDVADDMADDMVDERATDEQLAVAINARVGGWIYEIPRVKYNQMTRRLVEILKPLPAEDDDS